MFSIDVSPSTVVVNFSDSLPSGMQVASVPNATNTSGGVFSAAANATSISLSGGTISSSCSLSVRVKGTTAGAKNNTTGPITSSQGGTGKTSNTATLTVTRGQVTPIDPRNGAIRENRNADSPLR